MKNNHIKLERIVSDIKMRFDVEPEIQGGVIMVDAGGLTIDELKRLNAYLTKRSIEMKVQKSVMFILSI